MLSVLPVGLSGQDSSKARTAHVTYMTAATAYIDAGRADGLIAGARVVAIRSGKTVAVLKVGFLSTHQASCDVESTTVTLAVGDTVRYWPQAVPASPDSAVAAVAATTRAAPAQRSTPGFRVRGRVGFHYLDIVEHDGGGLFTQPGLDLRLFGGGRGPLGFVVDVRARQASVQEPPTRVFQAALTFNAPGSPYRMALGRQYAPGLYSVGLVDGFSAERIGRGFDVGLFTGTQPLPATLAYTGDVAQGGWYIRGHNAPGTSTSWSLTFGGSGSYQHATDGWKSNREFFVIEGAFNSRRASGFVSQEVDYYSPWKTQATGASPISPTSTYANFRLALTDGGGLVLNAGFDNRRNVWLYQDVVNPETIFDAAFRQGEWGGASARVGRHVMLAADARLSTGGSSGQTHAYSFSFTADRLAGLGLGLRSRTTRYGSVGRDGWLESLALGIQPGGTGWGSRVHFEVTGGWRNEQDTALFVPPTHLTWFGAELDMGITRAWYLTLSGTRQRGDLENSDLLYAGASVRF